MPRMPCARSPPEELRSRVHDPDELLWHIEQVRRRTPQKICVEIRAIESTEFGIGRSPSLGFIAPGPTASFFAAAKDRMSNFTVEDVILHWKTLENHENFDTAHMPWDNALAARAEQQFLLIIGEKLSRVKPPQAMHFQSYASEESTNFREILLRNGVQQSWIDCEAELGTRFLLALFDDDATVWPATWDGLEKVIDTYYAGDIANKMKQHWPKLRSSTWSDLESASGTTFSALQQKDGTMTLELYLQSEDNVTNARRFLADSVSVNRLFSGTGFTVDERDPAQKGTAEFFTANRLLSSIPPRQLVNISL
eukprot:Skav204509  [mRNA]  locus=scaffold527:367080:369479:+ [translate_table: standard]